MINVLRIIMILAISSFGRELYGGQINNIFTIRDDFNRTHLSEIDDLHNPKSSYPFLFSKNGEHMVFIKKTGDYDRKTYIFELILLRSSNVKDYIKSNTKESIAFDVIRKTDYNMSSSKDLATGAVRVLRG